jgi:hypothetical protein
VIIRPNQDMHLFVPVPGRDVAEREATPQPIEPALECPIKPSLTVLIQTAWNARFEERLSGI